MQMSIETTILGLIAQYGLPLVALVIVGWYGIKKLDNYLKVQQDKDEKHRQYMVDRIEKSESRQEEITKTNRELSETNKILVERFTIEMAGMKQEITEVGNKVDIINIKLDK